MKWKNNTICYCVSSERNENSNKQHVIRKSSWHFDCQMDVNNALRKSLWMTVSSSLWNSKQYIFIPWSKDCYLKTRNLICDPSVSLIWHWRNVPQIALNLIGKPSRAGYHKIEQNSIYISVDMIDLYVLSKIGASQHIEFLMCWKANLSVVCGLNMTPISWYLDSEIA